MKKNNQISNPVATAMLATNPEVQKTVKIAVGLTVVGVAGYFGYQQYKKWRKQRFVEKNAHLPDVQAAMILRKSMFKADVNLWPFGTIHIPDGTDESMMNQIAGQISSFENVQKAYNILFESNLIMDVQDELNNTELMKFFNALNSKGEYEDGLTKFPQTPFTVGTEIKVLNPDGTTIYKAGENYNGSYFNTGESIEFKKFDETIGTIIKVYKGVTSGKYYYVVDRAWAIDSVFGYGYVAHTEVTKKI